MILSALFHNKKERNKMLRNNILFSGLLKIIALVSSFLLVPITIDYLNKEVYGIWMTITSILFWINTFDIGLGNGMRNYLTASLSKGNYEEGREYISTTFCLLSVIIIIMAILLLAPLLTLDFNKIFNTTSIPLGELRNAMIIAVAFTLINFVLKNIGYIFIALQQYAINDMLNVAGSVISLIIIYILTKFSTGRLIHVVLVYTATYTVIYITAAFPTFKKHPLLKPKIKYFNKKISKKIVSKGLGFFIIQITSCLVIFGATNLFITRILGPTEVTVYNIAYKYFNLLIIAYTILISPMWNAYTDASVKGDWLWIKNTFNKAIKLWWLSVAGGGAMLLICNIFYSLWIKDKITVPFTVSASVMVYICFFNLNNCATYLINGLNKIKIQIITSVTFTALYIITIILFSDKFGIEGITLSMAASYALMSFIHLYQCNLLINRKANGIWNA